MNQNKVLSVFPTSKKSNRGQKVNISPVHQLANELNINIKNPENLNDENEYGLYKFRSGCRCCSSLWKNDSTKILNIQNVKFLNIHASILPRWRGAAPIQRAIIDMDVKQEYQ